MRSTLLRVSSIKFDNELNSNKRILRDAQGFPVLFDEHHNVRGRLIGVKPFVVEWDGEIVTLDDFINPDIVKVEVYYAA